MLRPSMCTERARNRSRNELETFLIRNVGVPIRTEFWRVWKAKPSAGCCVIPSATASGARLACYLSPGRLLNLSKPLPAPRLRFPSSFSNASRTRFATFSTTQPMQSKKVSACPTARLVILEGNIRYSIFTISRLLLLIIRQCWENFASQSSVKGTRLPHVPGADHH